jgi:hypothetical protein
MDPPTDTLGHPFNWPRLAIIATALVVSFAILLWVCTALMNCKRRRPEPTTMPRAYMLPVYVQRDSPRLSTSAAPSRSTQVYPLYPPMPSPDYSEEDPMANHYTRVATPLQARTRASHRHILTVDDVHVFGSVQRSYSRRHRRIHPALRRERMRESARESVETLPRYEYPPSYNSNNGF